MPELPLTTGITDPGYNGGAKGKTLVDTNTWIDSFSFMKRKFSFILVALAIAALSHIRAQSPEPATATGDTPIFKNLPDLKWDKILPDLGESSPEICFLRVDPKTHATALLIRTSKAIHVRKHWHTASESHTMISGKAVLACDGKRVELSPGGFNYMPAKMVHEAWLPANSLTFITVDGTWDVNWVEGPPTAADLTK
jgi:mannose-6-phosphate isomerase-like protein (cupin superfamily)